MGTGLLEQENLWGKADGSKSHTAFIPVIELPRIPAECLKVYCLPDDNFCLADENHRSPLDLEECPRGNETCTGDCYYYSEDPADRKETGDE